MNLEELEARLRSLIEVHLVNVLPGQKDQNLIFQKLTVEIKSHVVNRPDGKHVAPNVYTLLARADAVDQWKDTRLIEALIDSIKEIARSEDLQFSSSPVLTIAEDNNLLPGEIGFVASHRVEPMAETQDMQNSSTDETDGDAIPENAFLIIEGVKVFPLKVPVINIGRRLDNTLVIDDPRVSRNHAQLRAIKGRFVLFDLNSTGGTFVNGQRTSQSVLYPGDVVSLAGVALIFGQDNPPPRPDLAGTAPMNEAGSNRPTAIIQTMPPTKKKKK